MTEKPTRGHLPKNERSSKNPFQGAIEKATWYRRNYSEITLKIEGWLVNIDEKIVALQMGIPGKSLVLAQTIARPDIAHMLSNALDASDAGFRICLHLNDESEITRFVHFHALLEDGVTVAGALNLPENIVRQNETVSLAQGRGPMPVKTEGTLLEYITAAHHERLSVSFRAFIESRERIKFERPDKPVLSIITPLFNKAELTLECLRSLKESFGVSFELILINNASSDATQELLSRIDGPIIINNSTNMHFIHACNQGAEAARGHSILFLNNDTTLEKHSLFAATKLLYSNEDVGAVGGKLVRMDGKLQEAGAILFSDGSTIGYGVGENPNDGEYLFRRTVDYCSGAFLLTRKNLFDACGGFSTKYQPAYYEDVDYCLRIRQMGYRTLYEPEAIVYHAESSSSNEDSAARQQRNNRQILTDNHGGTLEGLLPPSRSNALLSRSRDPGAKRILIIEDQIPLRAKGSGFPRSNEIIRSLSALGHLITLFTMQSQSETPRKIRNEIPQTVEILTSSGQENLRAMLEERQNFFDFILVSRPHNMELFSQIWCALEGEKRGTIIYDAEAIYAEREVGKLQVQNGITLNDQEVNAIIEKEIEVARQCDQVIAVSESEAYRFVQAGCANVTILSHAVDLAPTHTPFIDRHGILFVGPIYEEGTPNEDAVRWFISEILPKVQSRNSGNILFRVAGERTCCATSMETSSNTHFLGPIADLTDSYATHRIFVAPIRYSAGISLKVIDAMAHGLPTVCTSLLARQLSLRDGHEVLTADTPEAFAEKCLQLHDSEALWNTLRSNGLHHVKMQFSKSMFTQNLEHILR